MSVALTAGWLMSWYIKNTLLVNFIVLLGGGETHTASQLMKMSQ